MSDRSLPGIQPIGGRKSSRLSWVVMGISLFFLIVVLSFALSGGKEEEYNSNTSSEAIAQCEAAIEERLKSPTTAEFNSSATGSGTWTVVGTVDAENSFGAMVRSSFQCSVIIDNADDTARVRIDHFE